MGNSEKLPSKAPDEEKLPQMSPEDIAEMRSQIPVLREMLNDRKVRLAHLGKEPSLNQTLIDELKKDIEDLEFEISGREES